ncbi:hypothetical protein AUJ77_01940 [Candidatus Nomurabacteria bacterium CG1_02_43_90]|uniref:Type II secretion system protein GspG C-terminal domain-containing protein n=1 Tax=Candidatus Nomurabacteria bacterium CG1_02_43_90 TaxID=1805281 RepID=A0A1J4V5J0_9BACT|nr:MAG: hypothetical protein AUJ77_01940 [Candidatus Nomurabacteria bacterium CG1_02_43_90]
MKFYTSKNQKKLGFTLIELLVVIAIIGVLATIILASLNSARAKARDAQRAESIRQVQTALELYYNTNGFYISSPDLILNNALTPALTPTYISKIPLTPSNPGTPYRYYNAAQSPATYYAIYIPYEKKPACYVCGGSICWAGLGWWGVNMC